MRKIAIVGLSKSTHDDAPWNDDSWEMWGLPWDRGYWVQYDRLFEMHDRRLFLDREIAKRVRLDDYLERLQMAWVPVYMQQTHPDIPQSIPYPLEELEESVWYNFPRRSWNERQADWYQSSAAYMLALAIHELDNKGITGLWGIDVTREDEFADEQPCLSYLIGYANGRGIDVILPEGPTELCKYHGKDIIFGERSATDASRFDYLQRYGYLT